jgi:hypothetical protein
MMSRLQVLTCRRDIIRQVRMYKVIQVQQILSKMCVCSFVQYCKLKLPEILIDPYF